MMMNEESVKGKIVLEGTLVLDAPLLIGTGGNGAGQDVDDEVLKATAGQPFIPGTSLAGALRDFMTAENALGMRLLFGTEAAYERQHNAAWQSSIRIDDIKLNNVEIVVRDGVSLDEITGTTIEHHKFDYEAVGSGATGKFFAEITQRGIARTFQNIRLFSELSVLDNVRIAFHDHVKYGVAEAVLRVGRYFSEEARVTAESRELLSIFKLADQAEETAKNLPYGAQRRLEIARALAAKPKLLLLDEPAAGMNPQETQELMAMIRWIRDQFDLTVLLIEHDMSLVMGICERIYVLEYGQIIAQGTPEEIRRDPEVIRAYLGGEA